MGVITSAQKTLMDLEDFSLTTINSNIEFETDVFGRDPNLINGCKISGQYLGFTVKQITLTAVVNQTKGVIPSLTIFGAVPVVKNDDNTYSGLDLRDLSWTNGVATFLVAVEDHRSKLTAASDIFFESILGGIIEIKGTYGGQSDTVIINWKKILKESDSTPKISQITNYWYQIKDTRPPYNDSPWPLSGWTQDETTLNIELEKYYWMRERVYYEAGTIPDGCNALRFYNVSKIDQDFLDKKNIKTISLYKRSNTVPARPTKDLTYDPAFLNGTYIPAVVDGWIPEAIPNGSLPCYVITYEGQCNFRKPIVVHTADWTDPIIYNENYIPYTIYSTTASPQYTTQISLTPDENHPYRGTISVPEDFRGQERPYPPLGGWVGPDGTITWTWVKYLGENGADAVRYYLESEPTQIIRDVLGQISSSACTIKTYKVEGDGEPTKLNSTQVKYKLRDSNNHYITITGEPDAAPEGTFIEPAYGNLNLNFTNSDVRARFSSFAYITVSAFNSTGGLLTTQQINYLVDSEAIINLHDELYIGDGVTIKEGLKLKSGDNLLLKSHSLPFNSNISYTDTWVRLQNGDGTVTKVGEDIFDSREDAAIIQLRNPTSDTNNIQWFYSPIIKVIDNWQGLAISVRSWLRAMHHSQITNFEKNNPVRVRMKFYDSDYNEFVVASTTPTTSYFTFNRDIIVKNNDNNYVYASNVIADPFAYGKYQSFYTTFFLTQSDLGMTQEQWTSLTQNLAYVRIAFTLYGRGEINIVHPKAEYGAFSSTWSESPEDIVHTMVEFKASQDNITSTVTAIDNNFWTDTSKTVTKISQIEQTADQLEVSVTESLNTSINYCSNNQLYSEGGIIPDWTLNNSSSRISSVVFTDTDANIIDALGLQFTLPSANANHYIRNVFIDNFTLTQNNKYCFSCKLRKTGNGAVTIRIRTSFNSSDFLEFTNAHDTGDPTTRTISSNGLYNIIGKLTLSHAQGDVSSYDGKHLVIQFTSTDAANLPTIVLACPKFEKGHIHTNWTPETLCAGSNVKITNKEILMTSPKFNLTVPKNTDGTGGTSFILQNDKVEFNTPQFNINIPAANDQSVALNKDGLVVGTLTATDINCPNSSLVYTGPTSIVIKDDSELNFKAVLESLSGHYIPNDVIIDLRVPVTGNIFLQGAYGPGKIRIIGDSAVDDDHRTITGTLQLLYNTCKIELRKINVYIAQGMYVSNGVKGALTCYGNTYVYTNACNFTSKKLGEEDNYAYAVCSRYGNKLLLGWDTITSTLDNSEFSYTLYATDESVLGYYQIKGNKNDFTGYWLVAKDSIITGRGTRPYGANSSIPGSLTTTFQSQGTSIGGDDPDTPITPTTAICNSTSSYSYNMSNGNHDITNLQQGSYGSIKYASLIRFDLSEINLTNIALNSDVKCVSANLTIRRMPGAGSGLPVELHLCTLSGTSRIDEVPNTITPSSITHVGIIGTLVEGKQGTFSIRPDIITNLIKRNPTIQAIGLYVNETPTTGDSYSKNYSLFNGFNITSPSYNPKLEITYIVEQK